MITPRQQILILDDDRFFTHLVRRLVTRSNHVVEECNEPARLDPAKLASFDLILLDVLMPAMDGIQMLEAISKYAPDTSVVLTTAVDQSMIDHIVSLCARLDIRLIGVLHKPFKSAELAAMIEMNATYLTGLDAHSMSEPALREALLEQRIDVLLQPQVCLSTGKWLGCEASALLHHDNRQSPLPMACVSDGSNALAVLDFTMHLAGIAMAHMRYLQEVTAIRLSLTLALPAAIAAVPEFAQGLLTTLATEGFPNNLLVLDLQDKQLVADTTQLQTNLTLLRQHGIRLSLSYHNNAPVSVMHRRPPNDEFRLDRRLVANLPLSQEDRDTATMVLNLGIRLCMPTIADGINDEDTCQWLLANGCDIGQGDYIMPPASPAELLSWQWERLDGSPEVQHKASA